MAAFSAIPSRAEAVALYSLANSVTKLRGRGVRFPMSYFSVRVIYIGGECVAVTFSPSEGGVCYGVWVRPLVSSLRLICCLLLLGVVGQGFCCCCVVVIRDISRGGGGLNWSYGG